MMKWLSALLLGVALFVLPRLAHAQPVPAASSAPGASIPPADELCSGCRLAMPEGTDKVPLVVALHGDYQAVAIMHDAWRRLAIPRGVAVLSLACPEKLGCKGSWWRWDGSPSWILGEIAKVEKRRAIDRDRLYLVGWSGGGSYMGWRSQELEGTFAAFVIQGGGMPPPSATCAPEKVPVYFLVGDQNPFHQLAKNLRDYYKGCGSAVTWDLLQGADHPKEWAALTPRRTKVMDFLLAQKRTPLPPPQAIAPTE